MNTTPTPGAPLGTPPPAAPTGMDGFFDSVRRTNIVRSEDRWIGGVAGGLALRMGIDPLIVRGLLGASVLLGGLGLVLYGVGWLLLPEQRDGRIHLQQLFRGDFDAAVIGGFLALMIGFAFPGSLGSNNWWGNDRWWGGVFGLVAVVVIIAIVASAAARNRSTGGPTSGPTTSLPPRSSAPVQPAAQPMQEGTTMYPAPPAPQAPAPQGPAPYGPTPYVAPHYGAQPYGQAPRGPAYSAPRPPAGPTVALPRGPKPVGPGARAVGVVAALGLLVLAALLYAERIGAFDGPVLLTTAAVVVVLCGLGIVVAGAFGRTSGGLGGVAWLTILVLAPIAAVSNVDIRTTDTFVGNVRYAPEDAATAEEGYSVFAGDVVVDLTELPTRGPAIEVPVHLGAGDLLVILPEDGAYTADIRLLAGQVTWLDNRPISGVNARAWQTLESPAVEAGATPHILLDISVGAGNLVVEEDS